MKKKMTRMRYKSNELYLPLAALIFLLSACNLVPQMNSSSSNHTSTASQQNQPGKSKPTPPAILSLRDAAENAQKRSIYISTAANIDAFNNDATYKQLLGQEFNMLVPENVMKMAVTHPNIDTFDYSPGDELVAFAKAHNMQVQGANLLWTSEVPAWITQGGYIRNELLGILKDYITNVVGHYKGQVQSWEVVNEPLDTNENNQPSIWNQVIGPDYMDYAFRWAHEANPQAKLYINEFGVETPNDKSNQYYNLVQGLIKRGVPISGVGFEDHLDITQTYSTDQMIANMQRFAKLGMQVQITEADIMLQKSTAPITQKLNQQAQIYANLIHVCQSVQACNAVTIWGFTDRYTWIPEFTHHPDQPLIFDAQYQKKPAYYAIKNALLNKS